MLDAICKLLGAASLSTPDAELCAGALAMARSAMPLLTMLKDIPARSVDLAALTGTAPRPLPPAPATCPPAPPPSKGPRKAPPRHPRQPLTPPHDDDDEILCDCAWTRYEGQSCTATRDKSGFPCWDDCCVKTHGPRRKAKASR